MVTDEEDGYMTEYYWDSGIDYVRSRTADDEGVFLEDGSRLISEIDPNYFPETDIID